MGDGNGFTVNAPLQAGSTIADYQSIFSDIFVPAIERFSPDVMIVSAGQDILFDDPIGRMNIRPQDFEQLTRMIDRGSRSSSGAGAGGRIQPVPWCGGSSYFCRAYPRE